MYFAANIQKNAERSKNSGIEKVFFDE